MDDIVYICMYQSLFRNLGTMSFTLQVVLKCFAFLGLEVCDVEMVLSKNTFCWKNSLAHKTNWAHRGHKATYIFPTQQKSIMLCDVDVSCICTHGRCHVMLTPLALTHMVGAARCRPNVLSSAAWPVLLRKLSPEFHDTRPETGARFPAKPFAGNRCPIWAARGGNRARYLLLTSLDPYQLRQIRMAGLPMQERFLHSHRLLPQTRRPKSKFQNPNGPFGVWILEFGFWILDLGFWILDFGFWILDQFSLPSFCGGPKRRRLDFGVWILDFGVWILEFGVWILDFGLSDTVWILHKIFPCHAGSGRRISVSAFRPFILFSSSKLLRCRWLPTMLGAPNCPCQLRFLSRQLGDHDVQGAQRNGLQLLFFFAKSSLRYSILNGTKMASKM